MGRTFPGSIQLGTVLGLPRSLACSLDWSFLVPLCPLVAIVLHTGVISISFNSIFRMGMCVCVSVVQWIALGKQGQEVGPCSQGAHKAEEAKPLVGEWRSGYLLRR